MKTFVEKVNTCCLFKIFLQNNVNNSKCEKNEFNNADEHHFRSQNKRLTNSYSSGCKTKKPYFPECLGKCIDCGKHLDPCSEVENVQSPPTLSSVFQHSIHQSSSETSWFLSGGGSFPLHDPPFLRFRILIRVECD